MSSPITDIQCTGKDEHIQSQCGQKTRFLKQNRRLPLNIIYALMASFSLSEEQNMLPEYLLVLLLNWKSLT